MQNYEYDRWQDRFEPENVDLSDLNTLIKLAHNYTSFNNREYLQYDILFLNNYMSTASSLSKRLARKQAGKWNANALVRLGHIVRHVWKNELDLPKYTKDWNAYHLLQWAKKVRMDWDSIERIEEYMPFANHWLKQIQIHSYSSDQHPKVLFDAIQVKVEEENRFSNFSRVWLSKAHPASLRYTNEHRHANHSMKEFGNNHTTSHPVADFDFGAPIRNGRCAGNSVSNHVTSPLSTTQLNSSFSDRSNESWLDGVDELGDETQEFRALDQSSIDDTSSTSISTFTDTPSFPQSPHCNESVPQSENGSDGTFNSIHSIEDSHSAYGLLFDSGDSMECTPNLNAELIYGEPRSPSFRDGRFRRHTPESKLPVSSSFVRSTKPVTTNNTFPSQNSIQEHCHDHEHPFRSTPSVFKRHQKPIRRDVFKFKNSTEQQQRTSNASRSTSKERSDIKKFKNRMSDSHTEPFEYAHNMGAVPSCAKEGSTTAANLDKPGQSKLNLKAFQNDQDEWGDDYEDFEVVSDEESSKAGKKAWMMATSRMLVTSIDSSRGGFTNDGHFSYPSQNYR